jgi:hypothetical protein
MRGNYTFSDMMQCAAPVAVALALPVCIALSRALQVEWRQLGHCEIRLAVVVPHKRGVATRAGSHLQEAQACALRVWMRPARTGSLQLRAEPDALCFSFYRFRGQYEGSTVMPNFATTGAWQRDATVYKMRHSMWIAGLVR